MVVIVMGVAGAGKTTVGRLLAGLLGCDFVDGDELHPDESVRKMSAGVPLTDDDRLPWLELIRGRIDAAARDGESFVVTCSALKKQYREVLMRDAPNVELVYLKGDYQLIERRMAERTDHFFDPALLQSQFDALEEPEGAVVVDVSADIASVVAAAARGLRAGSQGATGTPK